MLTKQQLYDAAKITGQQLYGKPGKHGTHGSHFSFRKTFEIRYRTQGQVEEEMEENESYEYHTFDPLTKEPLYTNADPIALKDALISDDLFTSASDGIIYIADQNWGTEENDYKSKTIIYVIC